VENEGTLAPHVDDETKEWSTLIGQLATKHTVGWGNYKEALVPIEHV